MLQDNQFKSLTINSWQKDWLLTLFLKLGLGITLPFFSDEAYYWVWGKNLKLSYFDHPPFSAWLFWLAQPLDSFLFSSRLLFVLLGHLTIGIWCHYLADRFENNEKRTLFWLLFLHPLVGLGGLVANPDIPFLFFWSFSLVFYLACLRRPNSWLLPIGLGISLGLGFDSKYLIGLIAALFIIHLVVSKKWRLLRVQHLVMPVLFGFIFSLPVWMWNYQNDWMSLKFQFEHGLGQLAWKPKWTLDFLLGTAILLFPPFLFYFWKAISQKISELHVVVCVGLLLFFTYTTIKGDTELNWPLMLYPSFFLLITPVITKTRWRKIYIVFFGLVGISILSFIFLNPPKSLHPKLQEGALYKYLYNETLAYRPLYTNTYQAASYFYFLSKKPFYKLRTASRKDEYDFMPESQPSEDVFYFIKQSYQYIPPAQLDVFTFEKINDLKYGFEVYRAVRKK